MPLSMYYVDVRYLYHFDQMLMVLLVENGI